ncbi:MAG: hypothetical protein R3F60_12210 [bacterium]
MRRSLLALLACLPACDDADPAGPASLLGGDGGVLPADAAAGGGADQARPAPDAATPAGADRWIGIVDVTEGVGIAGYFGTDVDAVSFQCPDGRGGVGVGIDDDQRLPPGDRYPAEGAIGPADGPCDPIETCAAPLGAAGSLLVRVASGSLAGCTVTVHEVADRPAERFEVWTCPGPVLDGQCAGPWFSGGDGEVASGEVGE